MHLLKLALAIALCAIQGTALAQSWPTKNIRIITTLAPGSATDIVARQLAERLSTQLGQPVIVENRPGASTTIGAGLVAKAEPDGYTLLVTSSAHTVAPFLYSSITYDTANDLAAIAPLANVPTVLIAPANKGYKTVQDLVNAARAKPGSINYASAAASTQLNAERFRRSAKFEAVHIGFKGAPEAINEVMAGRVDFYFSPIAAVLPLVRDGKVVALAVGSSKRASGLPDIPTTIEAGYPESDYNFWIGFFAPGKTPREIVSRLHKEASIALNVPEVRERIARLGTEPMTMTPEQFDQYIRNELKVNEALVKAAGMKAN